MVGDEDSPLRKVRPLAAGDREWDYLWVIPSWGHIGMKEGGDGIWLSPRWGRSAFSSVVSILQTLPSESSQAARGCTSLPFVCISAVPPLLLLWHCGTGPSLTTGWCSQAPSLSVRDGSPLIDTCLPLFSPPFCKDTPPELTLGCFPAMAWTAPCSWISGPWLAVNRQKKGGGGGRKRKEKLW